MHPVPRTFHTYRRARNRRTNHTPIIQEDQISMTSNRQHTLSLISRYLFPADIGLIRCVDERQATDNTNGVEIPGAVYGIIDAIKLFADVDEDAAWRIAVNAGIPIGAHIDEHHGALGCGYARLVETTHASVLAVESVPAATRLATALSHGGQVLTLLGEHNPTHAVINRRIGYSVDPDQAIADKLGIFNFDRWAAVVFADMLAFDHAAFANHLEGVYRRTVNALTGITEFLTIE